MGNDIRHKRGLRSALNTLKTSNGVKISQLYHLTDENRLTIGTSASTTEDLAKLSEVNSFVLEKGYTVLATSTINIAVASTTPANATDIFSFTLGSAGDYDIFFQVRGATFAPNTTLSLCLRDTNSNFVPDSTILLSFNSSGDQNSCTGFVSLTTTTPNATYKISAFCASGNSTIGNASVLSGTDGVVKVKWNLLNKLVPTLNPTNDQYFKKGSVSAYSPAINSIAPISRVLAAGVITAYPMVISAPLTADQIISEVTAAVAGSAYRVALYSDTGLVYPGSIVPSTDTGAISGVTTVVQPKALAVSLSLAPGLYWVAIAANAAISVRSIPVAGVGTILGQALAGGSTFNNVGFTAPFTFAALPSSFPAGATLLTNLSTPWIALRAV